MREAIYKRKSVRWFHPTPLNREVMADIRSKLDQIKPLFEDAEFSIEIVNTIIGGRRGTSPYHLVFCGAEKEKVLENIGFVGQQMSLYFTSIGIGSYWKMAKSSDVTFKVRSKLPVVIIMDFGYAMEPMERTLKEFKRKKLSAISEGEDPRLEAARLAPSAMNEQDWFFAAENGRIHCYRKQHGRMMAAMKDTVNCIDMGIAISHLAVETGEGFRFEALSDAPQRPGFLYVGTVL